LAFITFRWPSQGSVLLHPHPHLPPLGVLTLLPPSHLIHSIAVLDLVPPGPTSSPCSLPSPPPLCPSTPIPSIQPKRPSPSSILLFSTSPPPLPRDRIPPPHWMQPLQLVYHHRPLRLGAGMTGVICPTSTFWEMTVSGIKRNGHFTALLNVP
jgi:hypothetical protein